MNEPHNERRHCSPSATIIESSRLVPWLMLTSILSGVALSFALILLMQFMDLKREVRLQQLKIDEYRVALMNAGIDPNPHVDGESK